MVVDGAVDVSATVVVHVDDSTLIIFVRGTDLAARISWSARSELDGPLIHVESLKAEHGDRSRGLGSGCSPTGSDVSDNGGAHVQGAVNDEVDVNRAAFNRSKPQW